MEHEIGAALTALEPFPIDVIGMNCGTGPRQMADSLKYLWRTRGTARICVAKRRTS